MLLKILKRIWQQWISYCRVVEFIGLRKKNVFLCWREWKRQQTSKTSKKYNKKNIKHGDYKNKLFNKQQIYHKMKTIRSTNYLLGCFKLSKLSLKCFDDKRYIHEHGITSYTCRHYKIWSCDVTPQLWQSTYKSHNLLKQCRTPSIPTREKPLFQFRRVRNHYCHTK